jgi:hypothetical protein
MTPGALDRSAVSRADAGLPPGGLYRRLRRAVAEAALPTGIGGPAVAEADLAGLPSSTQRYLRFMGVVGRPRDWPFRVRFRGRFRIRPGGAWLPADAWQYNTAVEPARIFVMRLRVGHLVPFYGRDTYVRGRGHMIGTLLGRKVVDGGGAEFDHTELVIYLNDAVLLAPSTLLGSATSWTAVGILAVNSRPLRMKWTPVLEARNRTRGWSLQRVGWHGRPTRRYVMGGADASMWLTANGRTFSAWAKPAMWSPGTISSRHGNAAHCRRVISSSGSSAPM